jgi:hypothetical protein
MGTILKSLACFVLFVVFLSNLEVLGEVLVEGEVLGEGVEKRADDVNAEIQALQALVQQQAAALSSMQAAMTAHETLWQNKFAALESRVNVLSKPGQFTTH